MDWESEINDGKETSLLPEGEYFFLVKSCEKGTSNDGKYKQAKLKLLVKSDDGATAVVWDQLTLKDTAEFKIAEFFRSIGLKKHGEPFRMTWVPVPGSWGRVQIKQDVYNGKTSNKVEKYLDRDESFVPPEWCLPKQATAEDGEESLF